MRTVELNSPMLWAESEAFNFEKLIKNNNIQTIMGLSVGLDKVLYDITGETVVGVSGTFIVRGVKVRGVWDSLGNIMHFRKTGIMFNWKRAFENMFNGCEESMFQLVLKKEIK